MLPWHRSASPEHLLAFLHCSALQPVSYEIMPQINLNTLEMEDIVVDTIRDIPWRFGDNISVDIHPGNAGNWDRLTNGDQVWRVGIHSPGALSINLTFNRYRLPPGAELYIYSSDQSYLLGAFTDLNNQEDMYFATSVIPGESVIIEYYEPSGAAFPGELNLETVTHAYRSALDYAKRFGSSGACNINVACDVARGWQNERDAVVLMMVNSNSLCTGTLINNVLNDGRPLLLSANHCYRNPSTIVFWFNWQSDGCTNPAVAPAYTTMSGSVSRARSSVSDFWLLELNQAVPLSYNPYFAGWNRTMDTKITETVVSIHHPRGDIKKFSYAEDGAEATAYVLGSGSGTTHWRVTWSGGTTTEPASSGSSLFDSKGRIIGQLHGGYAACGNTQPDWYGRFGISWNAGQSSASRLKDWLDPFNTNVPYLYGYRPAEKSVNPPEHFQATAVSKDKISLSWSLNALDQPVLIAAGTSPSNITPSGAYALGDTLAGGSTVIFLGQGTQLDHVSLGASTEYHYHAWSYNNLRQYSSGVTTAASTFPDTIAHFPHHQAFDNPIQYAGWTAATTGNGVFWQFGQGNGADNPSAPYQGQSNAFFNPMQEEHLGKMAMLISPVINFKPYELGRLSFYYASAAIDSIHDILRVYYRPDQESNWMLLDSLTEGASEWRKVDMELPSISETYQLAFEAQWNGAHGVCLDEVAITASYDAVFPGIDYLAAEAESGDAVILTWSMSEVNSGMPQPTGFEIYRNDLMVATINDPTITTFLDAGLPTGDHTYHIIVLYDNPSGISEASEAVTVGIVAGSTVYALTLDLVGSGEVISPGTLPTLTYNEGARLIMEAIPAEGYVFFGWMEGGTLVSSDALLTMTITRQLSLTALFVVRKYLISLSSVPNDQFVLTGMGYVEYGKTIAITASVPFGWRFIAWKEGDEVVSTKPAFALTPIRDMDLTAYFEPLYQIELIAEPDTSGLVRGGGLYEPGSTVRLTAYPNDNWLFSHWEVDGESVAVDAIYDFIVTESVVITAVFRVVEFLIDVDVSHPEAVTVSGGGLYLIGATATLTVEIDPDWLFIGWFENGILADTSATISFAVNRDRHLVAVVEPKFMGLTIETEGSGTTTPEPGFHTFKNGSSITLSATPARGWRFKHWIINDSVYVDSTVDIFLHVPQHALAVFFFPTSTDTFEIPGKEITVFPNPTNGITVVQTALLNGSINMELFDISGQRILLSVPESDMVHVPGKGMALQMTFDMGVFKPGVYFLRLSDKTRTAQIKLIVY
jgi:hypothetical protein